MSVSIILSATELGLFYALLTLGLFISYRILDIPDLTVDGSFTLGAAAAVGWSSYISTCSSSYCRNVSRGSNSNFTNKV